MLAAEKEYLYRSNIYATCLREDAVSKFTEILLGMERDFIHSTLIDLKNWRFSLSEGNPKQKIFPLRKYIQDELQQNQEMLVKVNRKKYVEETIQMIRESNSMIEEDSTLYYSPSQQELENVLSQIHWIPSMSDELRGLSFELTIQTQQWNETAKIDQIDPSQSTEMIEKDQINNLENLIEILGKTFCSQKDIVTYIKGQKHPQTLAENLMENSKPMIDYYPHPSHSQHLIVSANWNIGDQDYKEQLGRGLIDIYHLMPSEVILDNFTNHFRLTAIRTLQGLILNDFETWDRVNRSFIQYIENQSEFGKELPALIRYIQSFYTQIEEQEAVSIEIHRIFKHKAYRMIDPRVVQFLGKRMDLERALKCFAMGWVRKEIDEDNPGNTFWRLAIPGLMKNMEIWLTPSTNESPDDPITDFDALYSMVVIGRNQCIKYERYDTPLPVSFIDAALAKANELHNGEAKTIYKNCLLSSLEEQGWVDRLRKSAGRNIKNGIEQFDDQALWDLAEYASDFFIEQLR